jgi:hypothetical protein
MPIRDTNDLKKLLYNKLKNDSTLVTLLGGNNKIIHANPLKGVNNYPCLVYNLIAEKDEPYDEDISAGISKSTFQIEVFCSGTSSVTPDSIEARVYELLHGKTFSNSSVKIKSCYRKNRVALIEEELDIHRIYTTYDIVNSCV